jgi:phage terminase Nu1 subunit (DNA packaging protein)
VAKRLEIRVNQRQLADLLRVAPERISQATNRGILHRPEGSSDYDLDEAVGEWLTYERKQHTKGERKSTLERERTRLTRAKAEISELRLALQRKELMEVGASTGILRAACVRLRSKFSASLQRIARGAYHANSLNDALSNVRGEYDVLLSELSNLETGEVNSNSLFAVVKDDGSSQETPGA